MLYITSGWRCSQKQRGLFNWSCKQIYQQFQITNSNPVTTPPVIFFHLPLTPPPDFAILESKALTCSHVYFLSKLAVYDITRNSFVIFILIYSITPPSFFFFLLVNVMRCAICHQDYKQSDIINNYFVKDTTEATSTSDEKSAQVCHTGLGYKDIYQ